MSTREPEQPVTIGRTVRRRQRWIEGGLIVAFWAFIFLLTVGRRAIDPRGPHGLTPDHVLHTGLEYGMWLLLTPGILWLCRRYSFDRGSGIRHFVLYVSLAVGLAVVMDLFGHATYNTLVRSDYRRPVTLAFSLFSLHFLDELIIVLAVLGAGFARNYFLRYRERQEEAARLRTQTAELQTQLTEARLQALRMQLNPHFLFNTLHAVSTLVERDPRGVRRMIARLSELLRYSLEHTATQEVPLHQELAFLNGYLDIQRIRFQGKLDVYEEIGPGVMDALVPNLILQPLVENAVKHGVSHADGTGRIEIRAWREGERLVLVVSDNGPGLAEASGNGAGLRHEGVGLRNTRERLARLYGAEQSLTLEPAGDTGLRARITLPYHTKADLRTVTLPATE